MKCASKAKTGMLDGLWRKNYNLKPFAESFDDFIDWKKRREGENGFLAGTLRNRGARTVLDAGMGTGCDAIYLKKEGFDVTGNEIDPAFRRVARRNFKKERASLPITGHEWRNFADAFGKDRFDAVLLLGNSLTYVFGREGQVEAVKNFYAVLKPGGILLMDERNYPKILAHGEGIVAGKQFCTGKYVYCGTKTSNYPIIIEEEKVVFEYRAESGYSSRLTVYPFKKGEMVNIIKAAGFGKIETYSDFKPGYSADADFFQHLAIK